MFPTLKHFGVGIIPWSPLARGLLTRPFKGDTRTTRGDNDRCVCSRVTPPPGLSNPLTHLSSSAISGYLEGPGTEDIINRSVASAYRQVHERGLQDLEQGRGDFQETWDKNGAGLLGMVIDTSYCAGRWLHQYGED